MKRILITGAAGFIGWHLASRLSDNSSNELVLVDNFSRGRSDEEFAAVRAKSNVKLLTLDLTNREAFRVIGNGFDHVYHLAAIIGVKNVIDRPWNVLNVNGLTTLHLLDWFRTGGGHKLFFASTSEAYAWTQQFYKLCIPTPEDIPLALTDLSNPRSSYAGSKIFGELAVTHACLSSNKTFVIARYHNVYGPRMGFEHVIPELCKRALSGENPLRVYSAEHKRAFCYISDAVRATIAAMESDSVSHETLNIGTDEEVTIGDLACRVLKTIDISAEIAPQRAGNDPINRRCPDISKLRRLLKYEPEVELDEGLKLTCDWYRTRISAAPVDDVVTTAGQKNC